MKYMFYFGYFLLASIFGFIFSGIVGCVLFGGILSFAIYYRNRKYKNRIRLAMLSFAVLAIFGYQLMIITGLVGAQPKVQLKLTLIKKELKAQQHQPRWFIMSQKRNSFFNGLLSKSKSKSQHLQGKAIDIYVFDIDGDNEFNHRDIKIFEAAVNKVEYEYPGLRGGLGDYFLRQNGYLTRHMIHIDTCGKTTRYTL